MRDDIVESHSELVEEGLLLKYPQFSFIIFITLPE